MGLDNGIMIKRKQNEKSNITLLLKPFEMSYDTEHTYDYEVCYWRKCWNVREDIISILPPYTEDASTVVFTIDMVKEVIKILSGYNRHTWNHTGAWAGSIWTWKEYCKRNSRHIGKLKKVLKLMKKYPDDIEVYFYDSY